jgi:hypothetical protein
VLIKLNGEKMKLDFKNSFWLAIPLTATIWLVSYLFGLLKIGVTPLFSSVSVTSVVTPTFGTKIFSFISGIVPLHFTLPTIGLTFLSAWATIILGTFLIGWNSKLSFLGSNSTGRTASLIFVGAIPVYLLLIGFKIPSLMTIVGSLIWIFVVSYVAGYVGGAFKKVI